MVTNALPPSAIARRISISWTLAAFTAASAPSISEATENDSTMPSASISSTFETPLMAGNTDSCRFGITNESITEKWPALVPAETAACTAATSPRTITMYLPEQMERDRTNSTLAAFSMASHDWNPAAMLVSSINPSELYAIVYATISTNSGVTVRTLPSILECTSAPSLDASTRPTTCPFFTVWPCWTAGAAACPACWRILMRTMAGWCWTSWKGVSRSYSSTCKRRRNCASGTRRYSFMGWTTTGFCCTNFRPAARWSCLPWSQASLGYRSSGQAYRVQRPQAQHSSDHWFQMLAPVLVKPRLRITLWGCTS